MTGNDVNVRSGPSTNYYPVVKLNAGTRVRAYEATDGWLAIDPPQGCFSLIHKDFVDIAPDSNEGVVNGDAVWVRAGSTMSDDLYAKQLKLNKGAVITVLGPHNDDFLRIAPPADARLFISQDYVQRLPETALARSGPAAGVSEPIKDASAAPAQTATEKVETAENAGQPIGDYRTELTDVDTALEAEEQKPYLQRDYGVLIPHYRRIADQKDDAYAASYAAARIAQLQQAAEKLRLVKQVRALGEALVTDRKASLQGRQHVQPPSPPIGGGFDVIGELRESMIFRATAPRRLRLVGDDGIRTVAYVEIPEESGIDVSRFLGRRVGVRAAGQRLHTEGVDPLLIYTVAELIVLDASPRPTDTDTVPADAPRDSAAAPDADPSDLE